MPKPIINKQNYPTNSQVFGHNKNNAPTPMSVSTARTNRVPSRVNNNNYFKQTGPPNFISEELYNVQTNETEQDEQNYEMHNEDEYEETDRMFSDTNQNTDFCVEASDNQH